MIIYCHSPFICNHIAYMPNSLYSDDVNNLLINLGYSAIELKALKK